MLQARLISPLLLSALLIFPLLLNAQEVQKSATDDYEQGIALFDKGLYEKAVEEFNSFIEGNPDHELVTSAKFYQTRSLGKSDSVNIESYYESYIRSHPKETFSQKLLFELANKAEERMQYDKAISFYQRSLNYGMRDKQAAEVNYWIAENYVSMGNKEQGRERFLMLADNYPESTWAPKALYARGRLYLSENKYDSSSAAFELLKDRYPNADITRRIGTALGESYYQQGKYEEAIDAFINAMPYLEDDLKSKAVLLIAESHNYLQNFDEASEYYLQYINREKGTDNERKAHYGLGWVYHKQEIYHWASEEFDKAATGDDELARKALYYKAVNDKLGGRYSEAIESFRKFGERYKTGLWVEEAYYEWAITAFELGQHGESVEVLLSLVRDDDTELKWAGKVYTLLGESYFANKEYTRALQAFEAAENSANIDPAVKLQARFQKAWVQYRNQAYKQAQPTFEQVYNTAPNTKVGKEALFWSADAHYQMKQFGPASDRFAAFIRQYPDHELIGAAYYSLGWSYFQMGSFAKAISPLKEFLENYDPPEIALFPYDTDTQLRLGDSYYAVGDYEAAIKTYQEAIGAEPGGDYAMFQIANSYYRAESTYEAVTTFRKFLRIYPYSRLKEQAQYNIAYIYLNSGNYSQAIEEFQTVINKYPSTSWAARSQYNIGDAYYNSGEYEKAIEAYKTVMEKYPKSDYIIEAVNGIEYAQLSAGKTDSSSAVLENFLADNPQTSTADRLRYRQAETLMQSGDYSSAIEELKQYIRITNNRQLLPEAQFSLANAYEQTNRMDKAVETYNIVVENYQGSERAAPSLAALGRISYNESRYRESFDYFNRLADNYQGYRLEAYIGMGKAQLSLDNISEAKSHYESALDLNGSYDPARVGLGKVALENGNYEEAGDRLSLVAESNTTEIGAEAQYLLGVIEQEQQQYEKALESYSNVKVLYSAYDNWVSKSMLRSAECYIQLGNTGEARNTLNSIVENYPGTEEAKKAQRLLDSGS
jgi:TolA-binding protein